MKKRWLIEIRNTHPVLYFRGVGVPNSETYLFTTNTNMAATYKTKKEAAGMVDKLKNINNTLVVVEHGFQV